MGTVDAEEVVQLYLSKPCTRPRAIHSTRWWVFERVALPAGATQTVAFTLAPELLATVDDAGRAAVQPGAYRLTVGGSSPGSRSVALGAPAPVVMEFVITAG